MTPKDRQNIETIKTMLIFCVNSINEHENRPVMKIEDFQPDLESVPSVCDEDKSKQAETMLKVARKHLKKADFKTMSKDELKAWAKRMEQITDMNWEESHLKEEL